MGRPVLTEGYRVVLHRFLVQISQQERILAIRELEDINPCSLGNVEASLLQLWSVDLFCCLVRDKVEDGRIDLVRVLLRIGAVNIQRVVSVGGHGASTARATLLANITTASDRGPGSNVIQRGETVINTILVGIA